MAVAAAPDGRVRSGLLGLAHVQARPSCLALPLEGRLERARLSLLRVPGLGELLPDPRCGDLRQLLALRQEHALSVSTCRDLTGQLLLGRGPPNTTAGRRTTSADIAPATPPLCRLMVRSMRRLPGNLQHRRVLPSVEHGLQSSKLGAQVETPAASIQQSLQSSKLSTDAGSHTDIAAAAAAILPRLPLLPPWRRGR